MQKMLRKFSGVIPLAGVLFCSLLLAVIENLTGYALRSIPQIIFVLLGLGSFGIMLFWMNTRTRVKQFRLRIFVWLMRTASVLLFLFVSMLVFVAVCFTYKPEHVVILNDQKLLARVDSFLTVNVYYYQYENILFYGKEVGYEYYGSGGYDPFELTVKPTPITSAFDR